MPGRLDLYDLQAPTPTAPGSQPSGLSNLPGCFTVFATETAVQWVSPSLSLATIGQVANEAAPYVRAATVIKGMEIKGTPVLARGAAKTAGRVARAARAGRWFRFGEGFERFAPAAMMGGLVIGEFQGLRAEWKAIQNGWCNP